MNIERLSREGWEKTLWHCLAEIMLSSNTAKGKFSVDEEYYYLTCTYEGIPEIYRMEK